MKLAQKWELWKWCIWSFRKSKSISNGRTNRSQLWSGVSAHELFTLAADWSLHRGQMMYYLSSPAAQGETMGLCVRVTVWGYFIPASFSTSVPCWTAVSVSASLRSSRLSDKSPEPGNHHSRKKMSRRSGDRIWVRAASSVHLYCCASGIYWH